MLHVFARSRSPKFAILLAFVVAMALSACGGAVATPTAAPTMPPIDTALKIGMQPWIGYGPWWIAQEKGLFKKHGLNVELVDFTKDVDLADALAAGKIHAGNVATHTAIKMMNKDIKIKLILFMDASYEADAMLTGPEIKTVADLKGKKIAFEEGSTSDLLLTYALIENGLSKKDIQAVPTAAADAGAALLNGSVDVAITYEPFISAVLSEKKDLGIFYSGKNKPGLISDFLVVPEGVLAQRGDAIKALMLAWRDAVEFLHTNPAEGRAIIAKAVGSPPEELQTAFAGVKIYTPAENKQIASSGDLTAAYLAAAEALRKMEPNAVKSIPDPAKVLTVEYLP